MLDSSFFILADRATVERYDVLRVALACPRNPLVPPIDPRTKAALIKLSQMKAAP
jgi:hypothetical protein